MGVAFAPVRPLRRSERNNSSKEAAMKQGDVSRRTMLKGGGAALAGITVMRVAGPAEAFPGHSAQDEQIPFDDEQEGSSRALQQSGGQVLPWEDQPPPVPFEGIVGNLLKWEELDSW